MNRFFKLVPPFKLVLLMICISLLCAAHSAAFDAKDLATLKKTNECDWCNLVGADLINANLQDASLYNANLRNAVLADADLRNAVLADADLRNANLKNAQLQNAQLENARLEGANLRNADLTGADLTNAMKDSNTKWSGAKLTGAIWINGRKCQDDKCSNCISWL